MRLRREQEREQGERDRKILIGEAIKLEVEPDLDK